MKRHLFAVALAAASFAAHAAVGVAVGNDSWSESDGFPNVAPGTQVKIYTCTGKMHGDEAGECAVNKCLADFGVKGTVNSVPKKKIHKTELYAGKCSLDGYSNKMGYSIIVVGPKGDNSYIMSKALGDITRDVAMKYVRSNNFPVDKGRIVFDYFDHDGVPQPGVVPPKK